MNVKTLNLNELNHLCKELSVKIIESNFQPDLILGVKTGGEEIAKLIWNSFQIPIIKIESCLPIRKTSLSKKNILKKFIKYLPTPFLNFLRIFEAKFFFNKNYRNKFISIELPNNIESFKRILIIDDAVDSGATLLNIIKAIKKSNEKALIKTAVITITQNDPLIRPDFTIYNNQTLIRFPWSPDIK